jgi:hypothetical protein
MVSVELWHCLGRGFPLTLPLWVPLTDNNTKCLYIRPANFPTTLVPDYNLVVVFEVATERPNEQL